MTQPSSTHRNCTLVFLFLNNHVLLGRKARGIGAGILNGFGGLVEFGETEVQAARREFSQETGGVEVLDPEGCGIIDFTFEKSPLTLKVYVFRATQHSGIPRDTPEMMRIRWYPVARPPFDEMWPGDRLWFPLVVQGVLFRARIHYDSPETRRVLRQSVEILEGSLLLG